MKRGLFFWLAVEAMFRMNLVRIGLDDCAYARQAYVILNLLDC